jgi:hypothetical protein
MFNVFTVSLLERDDRRWQDNIKIVLKEIILLFYIRTEVGVLVMTVMGRM